MKLEYRIYRDSTGSWIAKNDKFDLFVFAETLLELESEIIEHDKYIDEEFRNSDESMSEGANELKDYLLSNE